MKRTLVCGFIVIIFLLPIAVTFSSSFMTQAELADNAEAVSFNLIPAFVSLKQYKDVLFTTPYYLDLFWNSVFLVIPITVGQIVFSFFTAYGLWRSGGRLAELCFFIYVLVMLMPYQVICVPNYLIIDRLGLMDTRLALILPALFAPLGVFLNRQFLKTVPEEYIESAKVEGAGDAYICLHIIAPLMKTAFASLAVLTFVEYWNMVEQPLIFLQDSRKAPLSVLLSVLGEGELPFMFAASVIYMAPAVLFFFHNEKHFVKSIQLSGLK